MSNEARDWSFISGAQFEGYLKEAENLIKVARDRKIHPFAAAIAGVAFIRTALTVMGGRVEWWIDFVRTGELPGFGVPPSDPSQNPPRA
jgi:hypothetical protein